MGSKQAKKPFETQGAPKSKTVVSVTRQKKSYNFFKELKLGTKVFIDSLSIFFSFLKSAPFFWHVKSSQCWPRRNCEDKERCQGSNQ